MTSAYDPALWRGQCPPGADRPLAPARNLTEILSTASARHGERQHLRLGDLSLSYKESWALSGWLAGGLRAAGVKPGDRVAICLSNTPAYVLLCFALWRLGAVGVGLNPLYAGPALRTMIEDSDPVLVATLSESEIAEKLREAAGGRRLLLCRRDGGDLTAGPTSSPTVRPSDAVLHLADLLAPRPLASDESLLPPDSLAMIQYTGGTTGAPKGAMLTHENLWVGCHSVCSWMDRLEAGAERWYAAAPLSHITGLICFVLTAPLLGGAVRLIDRFDPAELVALARAEEISVLIAIPTMLVGALAQPDTGPADWRGVKHVIAGGAPVTMELKQRFRAATGLNIQPGYALTETACNGVMMPGDDVSASRDATGIPMPEVVFQVRRLDDPELEAPLGEPGEICLGGPSVVRGYWRREAPDQFTRDGLLRTGDIGYMGPDGYVEVVDRLKDMIICSGYNVYPRIVEDAILAHPGVADVLAAGVPHPYRGETVGAAVVLRTGQSLTAAELKAFLAGRLSPIEMPTHIEMVETLPKTENMKLSRRALRERFARAEAP